MSIRGRLRHLAVATGTFLLAAWITSFAAPALAVPTCAALATDPHSGLVGDPAIKSATSTIVPASSPNAAYCSVHLLYGTNPNQNINIVLALPLSAADGGSGGLQGAWNGRTQGLGGGGCSGISAVNAAMLGALNTGYVASGTDLGHSGGNCEPASMRTARITSSSSRTSSATRSRSRSSTRNRSPGPITG